MEKQKNKLMTMIRKNLDIMHTPLMSILPGQISFFVILSVVPLLSILAMIISKLSFSFEMVGYVIDSCLPTGISSIVFSIFEQQRVGAADIFFIITAFYLASKATHSIIVASTTIYNGKQTDFIRTRVKAIIMLIILVILVISLIGILTVGGRIVNYLGKVNDNMIPIWVHIYEILKYPLVFFMIFFVVKVVYTISPNVAIPSKSVNKGALLTTVIWVVSTCMFSFYVTNIANYSKFYGNLSNLIIVMIWIYWLCYVFVFGMTFNEYNLTNKGNKESV